MSSIGSANGYQALSINGARRGLGVTEKVLEPEGNRSGNGGFAMTERDFDERVCFFCIFVIVLLADPLLMHAT